MNKREFIKSAAAFAGVAAAGPLAATNALRDLASDTLENTSGKATLKKGLVFGMIKEEVSLADKFKIARDAGFDGVELNSPSEFKMSEILEAKRLAGIELPSVINKDHWSKPLSDPDPEVRRQCIESVVQSLHEVKEMGGNTVLVVPGVVNNKVGYEQAYNTALESVRKLIPHVEETGTQIGLENVWNNFLISPIEAKRFVDEINHPLIGWYFDIGNVLRYGWPEHWIKTLNSRIKRLHLKEFSRELMNNRGLWAGFDVELLKGNNNWPVVMQALKEVNYQGGWITAEVEGGDRNRLKVIAKEMDEIISFLK